jgi:hypothetical protein
MTTGRTHRRAAAGVVILEVFEVGLPQFRSARGAGPALTAREVSVEALRPDGTRQSLRCKITMAISSRSTDPRAARVHMQLRVGEQVYPVIFEHEHAWLGGARQQHASGGDHVMADAAVSVLVGSLARTFSWLWMDPLAGIAGACVIGSWSMA